MSRILRISIIAAATVAAAVMLWVYAAADPSSDGFFPRCPTYALTGLRCPGCGTQRALHALLHGDIATAWHFNPAFLISLPLIALLLILSPLRHRWPRVYTALNGRRFIQGVIVAMLLWMLLRNLLDL